MNDSLVTFQTSEGLGLRGTLHRVTPEQAVFETYSPEPVLRMSEVLTDFTLVRNERPVYSGKAVVANLIQSGPCTLCSAQLEEPWREGGPMGAPTSAGAAVASFGEFMRQWGQTCKVLPAFKVVIADLHTFLTDLRRWLEQIELVIRTSPAGSRLALEREWMEALTPSTTAAIAALYERFDQVARTVEPEFVPAHQAFGRRNLHPLILASPFVYRTLQKPLGYAGDYEMVNMMERDPYQGSTLFAKAFNVCALSRPPIVAHRNRLRYLTEKLLQETVRNLSRGQPLKVLNVGCGPALEVQAFLRGQPCSNHVEFTLIDFDPETLDHVGRALTDCKKRYGRSTKVQLLKRSVQKLLKESARSTAGKAVEQYDFAYCAGLFDYLPDPICRCLIGHFYDLLTPGGLLLVTNVDTHSSRTEMEYFLEWHLIYRDTQAMLALVPPQIQPGEVSVLREPSGVNIFLEIRKPRHE
jgi:extracellular factor (EF) 3-hydroxypalmitic acid methyl ester biosynthesis protein